MQNAPIFYKDFESERKSDIRSLLWALRVSQKSVKSKISCFFSRFLEGSIEISTDPARAEVRARQNFFGFELLVKIDAFCTKNEVFISKTRF